MTERTRRHDRRGLLSVLSPYGRRGTLQAAFADAATWPAYRLDPREGHHAFARSGRQTGPDLTGVAAKIVAGVVGESRPTATDIRCAYIRPNGLEWRRLWRCVHEKSGLGAHRIRPRRTRGGT